MQKVAIAVDTGNKAIKTSHFAFIAGVSQFDERPVGVSPDKCFEIDGDHFAIDDTRCSYQRDKSESSDYKQLTLVAIAKELNWMTRYRDFVDQDHNVEVTLLAGLPPAQLNDHRLREDFEKYFEMQTAACVIHQDQTWQIRITNVQVYPQCFAALMTIFPKIWTDRRVLGIDIGGFTADYMFMSKGEVINAKKTESMEKGVIPLYREIEKKCRNKNGEHLEEDDIDDFLLGEQTFLSDSARNIIRSCAVQHVDSLLSSFAEVGVDLRNYKVVFMGGGSIILRDYLLDRMPHDNVLFLDDIHANAKGYELLYKASASTSKEVHI